MGIFNLKKHWEGEFWNHLFTPYSYNIHVYMWTTYTSHIHIVYMWTTHTPPIHTVYIWTIITYMHISVCWHAHIHECITSAIMLHVRTKIISLRHRKAVTGMKLMWRHDVYQLIKPTYRFIYYLATILQPRWLSVLRRSRVHSLMIARRSLCPDKLGSNPGQGSKGINTSGWHGLDMSITVTKRRWAPTNQT